MPFALDWRRIVDFVVLTGVLYFVLRWASRARALRIVLAITALYAGVLFARQFDLFITAWLLEGAALISVALLVIVFQPEVRRALTRLDRRFLFAPPSGARFSNDALAASTFDLAAVGLGALFVVVGKEPVNELLDGGVVIGADISRQLIMAIFQKNSPLHDGAVVIETARIAQAGAVLPLTQRTDVPDQYGTRHRAAMGLAERTDALTIVVSEERSEVTLLRGRSTQLMRTPEQLAHLLDTAVAFPSASLATRLRGFAFSYWRIKLAALGLASLLWLVALIDTSSTVRVVDVPIEFQNVPTGLDVVDQSTSALSVELRGRSWLMNSNQVMGLIARFNLAGAQEGVHTMQVAAAGLGVPPSVQVMRVNPPMVKLRLLRHKITVAR